jgi:DNA-binding NarL/FixJ family response regulator
MNAAPIKVLLIDDDPIQVQAIQNLLSAAGSQRFELNGAGSLPEGLERLAAGGVDGVLLDLGLPDSSGVETFTRLHGQFPGLPVVVLTSLEDEELGLELVQAGAQDYLVKGKVSSLLLCRTLRYAIERKQAALERDRLIGELQHQNPKRSGPHLCRVQANPRRQRLLEPGRDLRRQAFGRQIHPRDMPGLRPQAVSGNRAGLMS